MDRQIRNIRYMLLSLLLLASSVVATATADRVVVTSGRVVYDPFGHAVATYHPTVDTDSVDDFIAAIDTVDPTCTMYDILDRPVRVVYPDGEKVCYWYDGSGQLTEAYVKERHNGYRYVQEIGYDKFGDRVYMRYGNGAETEYAITKTRPNDAPTLTLLPRCLGRPDDAQSPASIIKTSKKCHQKNRPFFLVIHDDHVPGQCGHGSLVTKSGLGTGGG